MQQFVISIKIENTNTLDSFWTVVATDFNRYIFILVKIDSSRVTSKQFSNKAFKDTN